MRLNQEAVRALLLYLEDHLEIDKKGHGHPLRLKDIIDEEALPRFSSEELLMAASYLKEKQLIKIVQHDRRPDIPKMIVPPRAYQIYAISATGYDYLGSIRSDTLWAKLKEKISDITSASIPQIIAVAAELTAKSLF